ncbi:MAG TPA: cytochrome c biogenesis protein CcdA [Dehalococcoidia bacterium]|nr:cytochrome c biogenesis protein CcdA [Dehalococcoidia bacterium]
MSRARSVSDTLREANVLRSVLVPVLVAGAAIAIAFLGALLIGREDDIDGVNGFVEFLSGNSSSFLGGLVGASFLFAFTAGLASAVNPCGFAMLPAYLGLYLGTSEAGPGPVGPARLLGRALLIGGAVTAGFIVLFGVVGTAIGLGASFIAQVLPWVGLAVGILLAVAGAWIIGGGKLYTGLAARAASHIGEPNQIGIKGYFLFGISYGTASLSCTLPIFLAVLGVNIAGVSLLNSTGQFLLYALGMGLVIVVLTLGMAFFKGAMVTALRKALPYIQPIGAALMVIAGVYIIFYWLTLGGLLPAFGL